MGGGGEREGQQGTWWDVRLLNSEDRTTILARVEEKLSVSSEIYRATNSASLTTGAVYVHWFSLSLSGSFGDLLSISGVLKFHRVVALWWTCFLIIELNDQSYLSICRHVLYSGKFSFVSSISFPHSFLCSLSLPLESSFLLPPVSTFNFYQLYHQLTMFSMFRLKPILFFKHTLSTGWLWKQNTTLIMHEYMNIIHQRVKEYDLIHFKKEIKFLC